MEEPKKHMPQGIGVSERMFTKVLPLDSFTVEEVGNAQVRRFDETILTDPQIRGLMDKAANIRNMSVIAHGKSQAHINGYCMTLLTLYASLQSTMESPHLPIPLSNAPVLSQRRKLARPVLRTPARTNRTDVLPSSQLPYPCMRA